MENVVWLGLLGNGLVFCAVTRMHSAVGIFIACLRKLISFLMVCVLKKKKVLKKSFLKKSLFSKRMSSVTFSSVHDMLIVIWI